MEGLPVVLSNLLFFAGIEIQDNQAAGIIADEDNFCYYDTELPNADCEIFATIVTKPATDEYIELLARFDFNTGNGY